MARTTALLTATLAAAAATLLAPSRSHACGGCFAPTGQPSAVTAHRMAVALSPEESVLWDQFQYDGDPDDFVWVLPVPGGQEVDLELSSDTFFQALQQGTQVQLTGPNLGGGTSGCAGFGCGGGASGGRAAAPESGMVTVYKQETVGPYETVVIGSEDSMELVNWLRDHDYAVPDNLLPIIQHYVELDSNFAVLRLSPGEGVDRIQPIRVSCPSLMTALPLKMITAGVRDTVSLELFIFADRNRYRAANFANATVPRDELAYDLSTGEYNYDELAAEALEKDAGRVWLTEYAMPSPNIGNIPVAGGDAGVTETAEEDWAVVDELFDEPYLTRMRAELFVEDLDEDLILQPAAGLGDLPPNIQVEKTTDGSRAEVIADDDRARASLPFPMLMWGAMIAVLGWRRRRTAR